MQFFKDTLFCHQEGSLLSLLVQFLGHLLLVSSSAASTSEEQDPASMSISSEEHHSRSWMVVLMHVPLPAFPPLPGSCSFIC